MYMHAHSGRATETDLYLVDVVFLQLAEVDLKLSIDRASSGVYDRRKVDGQRLLTGIQRSE